MATQSPAARGLIGLALAGVAGLAAWSGRAAWEDSGAFALVLFGVPLACAALALLAESAGAPVLAPAVVAVLGAASVGWSLLTGLGLGPGLLLPSLLLLVAAMISRVDRRRDRTRRPPDTELPRKPPTSP
ncbi:hypothetical protein [Blastococcus sp. SYSU DS0973]